MPLESESAPVDSDATRPSVSFNCRVVTASLGSIPSATLVSFTALADCVRPNVSFS